MSNRYGAKCFDCSAWVPPQSGDLNKVNGKWRVSHKGCSAYKPHEARARGLSRSHSGYLRRLSCQPGVAAVFPNGDVAYQNPRGRCEDAPCCGCCN